MKRIRREWTSPRILITRLSAIGDCVHTVPLVSALRARFPSAYIAWVTQSLPATLLHDYPGLDELIIVDRNWMKSAAESWRLRRLLRQRQFDICLDPQSLTKSAALAWISGARSRIGFAKPQGRELSLVLNNVLIEPTTDHVVDRYLQLLEPLGILRPSVEFKFPETSHERIDNFIESVALTEGYAVLNPGAGWGSKVWPASCFAQLARYLGEQHQLPSVVVWAGDEEQGWADEIVAHSGGHAWKAPPTDLRELASVLRRAKLCVAGDTGPLHLAVAVGTRCVGLFGPTLPAVSGPYGPPHQSVQAYHQTGTSRERRRASNDAMAAIDLGDVRAACDRVLAVRADSSQAA